MSAPRPEILRHLLAEVRCRVSDDGTGDVGVIVRQALADDPCVTVEEIVEIVRQARSDYAAESARDASVADL